MKEKKDDGMGTMNQEEKQVLLLLVNQSVKY
ncbi:hypothetical protein LSPCS325_34460 [Lysinibacillus sp. CTST325]